MSSRTHGQLSLGGKLRCGSEAPRRACSGRADGHGRQSAVRPRRSLFMVLAGATGSPPGVCASATLVRLLARLSPGYRVHRSIRKAVTRPSCTGRATAVCSSDIDRNVSAPSACVRFIWISQSACLRSGSRIPSRQPMLPAAIVASRSEILMFGRPSKRLAPGDERRAGRPAGDRSPGADPPARRRLRRLHAGRRGTRHHLPPA